MSEVHPTIEYRDIPGFPGYRVGSDGGVWSSLNGKYGLRDWWTRLSPGFDRRGSAVYLRVSLRDRGRRKSVSILVHILVLLAFRGPCPDGLETRHLDGDGTNNRLDNLEYSTHQINVADRTRHGTEGIGGCNAAAIFGETDVREMRQAHEGGESITSIATRLGAKYGTVWLIVRRKNWRHVT